VERGCIVICYVGLLRGGLDGLFGVLPFDVLKTGSWNEIVVVVVVL
jgi:hypothetical protein